MNKKGMQFKVIVMLVLLIVFLALILLFELRLGQVVKHETYKDICQTSVYAHSKLRIEGVPLLGSEIICPVMDLYVDFKDPEAVKQLLAKDMYDCWDQFGEGQLELFQGDGTFCVICSRITFEDKDEKIEGFYEYLSETKIEGEDMTFMEYFAPSSRGDLSVVKKHLRPQPQVNIQSTDIDTNKEYATIFVQTRGTSMVKYLEAIVDANSAHSVGMLIGGGVIVGAGFVIGTFISGGGLLAALGLGTLATGAVGGGTAIMVKSQVLPLMSALTKVGPTYYSQITFREYDEQRLDQLGCTYLPAAQSEQ